MNSTKLKWALKISILGDRSDKVLTVIANSILENGYSAKGTAKAHINDDGEVTRLTHVTYTGFWDIEKANRRRAIKPRSNIPYIAAFFRNYMENHYDKFASPHHVAFETGHLYDTSRGWSVQLFEMVRDIELHRLEDNIDFVVDGYASSIMTADDISKVWTGDLANFFEVTKEGTGPVIPASSHTGASGDDDVERVTAQENVYVRPNGENYYPRSIMGHVDVALLQKFRKTRQYCQLVGPPGTGKTALAEAAFGEDLITVNGHNEFLVSHFVGSHIPNRNKKKASDPDWLWVDGPLTRAMKEGRPLLIDEATRIPSGSLEVVISATDGRNVITLDDLPDAPEVKAEDGFYVVMSYNPDTLNGRVLDDAIRSRFGIVIKVETDFDSLSKLEIPPLAVKVAKRMQQRNEEFIRSGSRGIWVPQLRELLFYKQIVDEKLGEDFAWNNLFSQCPEMYREFLYTEIRAVMNVPPVILGLESMV